MICGMRLPRELHCCTVEGALWNQMLGQLTVSWMLRNRSSCRAAFKGAAPASMLFSRAAAPHEHPARLSAEAHSL